MYTQVVEICNKGGTALLGKPGAEILLAETNIVRYRAKGQLRICEVIHPIPLYWAAAKRSGTIFLPESEIGAAPDLLSCRQHRRLS